MTLSLRQAVMAAALLLTLGLSMDIAPGPGCSVDRAGCDTTSVASNPVPEALVLAPR